MDSVCRVEFEYDSLHSLHDRVHPSTRSECDVTFELYCTYICTLIQAISIVFLGM